MQNHVAILSGGTSTERAVALRSAQNVEHALRSHFPVYLYDFPEDLTVFLSHRHLVTVAVPVFHGVGGEDGTIQGFLRTLGIPFMFSDVGAHALGMNKVHTKIIASFAGVQTPPFRLVSKGQDVLFEEPTVVKVITGGSSIGVRIAHTKEAFETAILEGFIQADTLLLERYVQGREFTVPVIDRARETHALPVIEIVSKKAFFDFESKYDSALAQEICPARIDEGLACQLQEASVSVHRAIGARHISRSDFIVDAQGAVWFLEINTIPGMTAASLLPKSLAAAGIDFGVLLKEWIDVVLKKENRPS